MTNEVRDKELHHLSLVSYKEKPAKNITLVFKDGKETWDIKSLKEFTLHDKTTGFDAVVYKKEDNVVVAFRGTQGDDLLGEGLQDVATDIDYIVRKMDVKKEVPKEYKQVIKKPYYDNQFTEAEDLVKAVKKKYPHAKVSLTGHSLGGALASYAGAIHDVDAVTYSAPSVLEILPEELQKKAKKGEYDQSIVNYIHPKDSIGAGAFNPYDRHIGSSYYIGSSFEFENAEYQNKPFSRFYSSIAKDKFHDLNHYSFDGLGNLSNPTLTNVQTGRELWQSPRYISSDRTTIRITPEHLEDVIKDLMYFLTRVDDICVEATSFINRLDGIKKSAHTQEEAVLSIQQFRRWFSEETSNISINLNDASKAFVKADTLE